AARGRRTGAGGVAGTASSGRGALRPPSRRTPPPRPALLHTRAAPLGSGPPRSSPRSRLPLLDDQRLLGEPDPVIGEPRSLQPRRLENRSYASAAPRASPSPHRARRPRARVRARFTARGLGTRSAARPRPGPARRRSAPA